MTTDVTRDAEPVISGSDEERRIARKRLEAKRKLRSDVVTYVVINAFLVVVWALGDRGSFWPGWVMAGWGVLLLLDSYKTFGRGTITEADVDEELRRRR